MSWSITWSIASNATYSIASQFSQFLWKLLVLPDARAIAEVLQLLQRCCSCCRGFLSLHAPPPHTHAQTNTDRATCTKHESIFTRASFSTELPFPCPHLDIADVDCGKEGEKNKGWVILSILVPEACCFTCCYTWDCSDKGKKSKGWLISSGVSICTFVLVRWVSERVPGVSPLSSILLST